MIEGAVYGAIGGFTTGAIMGLVQGLATLKAVGACNTPEPKPTPNELGKQGEEYIETVRGLEKNNSPFIVNKRTRIPDFFSKEKGVLIESKNVARQGLTKQLKDYLDIARKEGVRMEIYVRKNTYLTKPLLKFIKDNNIVLNYFPW